MHKWRLCSLVVVLEVLLVRTLALTGPLAIILRLVTPSPVRRLRMRVLLRGVVRWGGGRRWKRRWWRCRLWPMTTLVQPPLSVELRGVKLHVLLVLVVLRWILGWKPRSPRVPPRRLTFWGRLRWQ